MAKAPTEKRPLALRIRECGTDMATRSRRVLYHGCCTCCCCVWSISGLLTGVIAYASSTNNAEALVGSGARNVRQAASNGMFIGCLSAIGLAFMGGTTALAFLAFGATPALLLFAAAGGYISSKMCEPQGDEVEHLIAQRVVSRAVGSMAVGAIVGTLGGLAPCLFLSGSVEAGMTTGLAAAVIGACFAGIRSDSIIADGAIPRRAISARAKQTGQGGGYTLTPSKVAPARTGTAARAYPQAVSEQDLILFIDDSAGKGGGGTGEGGAAAGGQDGASDGDEAGASDGGVTTCGQALEAIHCPVCGCAFAQDDELLSCDRCETPHHKACWEYNVGCAIFGCGSAATTTTIDVDYDELKGLAYDWFWASRLRWWATIAAVLFLALAPIFYVIAPWTHHTYAMLQLAVLSLAAFAITSLPALQLRGRINKLVKEQLEPSEALVTQLVRRFDTSRSEPILQRLAYRLPLIYPVVAMSVLLAVWPRTGMLPFDIFAVVGGFIVAELACIFIVQRARRRQVVIESITGRILASERTAQRKLES